ncbi:MAG: hypothetical protein R3F42_15750 [Pseudomonadota bacterium]
MDSAYTGIQRLAFVTIAAGCLLALVTACVPQPTGAWHLAGCWLFCGLIPYVVCGSLATVLPGCVLLAAGAVLLGADALARTALGMTAATAADPWAPVQLAVALVLAVLPAVFLTVLLR